MRHKKFCAVARLPRNEKNEESFFPADVILLFIFIHTFMMIT